MTLIVKQVFLREKERKRGKKEKVIRLGCQMNSRLRGREGRERKCFHISICEESKSHCFCDENIGTYECMYCFNETNCQIFPYLNETECLEMSLCIDAHGHILAGFTPVKERKSERARD
jgi:hypothetical protein